jgi:hypothetical protein
MARNGALPISSPQIMPLCAIWKKQAPIWQHQIGVFPVDSPASSHKSQVRKIGQLLAGEQLPRSHRKGRGFQTSIRDMVNTKATSGLVLHLATDCNYV